MCILVMLGFRHQFSDNIRVKDGIGVADNKILIIGMLLHPSLNRDMLPARHLTFKGPLMMNPLHPEACLEIAHQSGFPSHAFFLI